MGMKNNTMQTKRPRSEQIEHRLSQLMDERWLGRGDRVFISMRFKIHLLQQRKCQAAQFTVTATCGQHVSNAMHKCKCQQIV